MAKYRVDYSTATTTTHKTLEAATIALTGKEGQWTDFLDGRASLLWRLSSESVVQITRVEGDE